MLEILVKKFAQKKKKKTLVLTNVGKRAVGGITYPPDLEPSVPGI
jgi:hypothetical protein